MAPVTAFAAALLLSVSSAPAPEVRAAVEVAAPRHASAPRAQEAAASTATDTIAVTAFENITGATEDDWIGVGIAETLAADVATGGALSVGLTPTEAGRESGARWVITGAYQRVGDQLRITARVVEVATDAVVHTAMVDGPMSELFALQDQLSAELSRGLTASSANATSPAAPTTTTDNAPANTAVTPSSRPAVSTTAGADGGGLAVAPADFIDGPPPPVAPETIARDAAGRATVRAVLLDEPLQVDGELNEAIYDTVPPVSDFIQQLPDVGEPATERTDTWIFYDAQNVYVAARNWDSAPESQWVANEMQRDSFQLINNDSFSVGFDTFYDRRNGFIFMVNPIGGIFDFQITDEGNPNTDWNPVWDVQTGRFDGGWTVEMEIPFKSIRFRPGTSQIWGLQIGRNVRWKNEWTYLTPVPISGGPGMFRLSAAGTLTGVEVPEGNRTFEIKPYGIGSMATDVNAVPLVSNAGDGDFGLDVKYGVTQNLTADFTYNTDFAQVEVDEQQVNLTRFSLFFPEKREFFLEGRGIYDFGRSGGFGGGGGGGFGRGLAPTLFFSRQIGLQRGQVVPILGGGRLTGKAGAFSIGALNMQTDDETVSGARSTNFTVLRVKRDLLRRSSVGMIYTGRSVSLVGDGASHAYGMDANFAFFENVNFNGYFAKTHTPDSTGKDTSYQARFNYAADRWGVEVDHLLVEDNFVPEVGFVRRDDFRRTFVSGRFSPRPAAIESVRRFVFQTSLDYTLTADTNVLETRQNQLRVATEFENSDQLRVDLTRSYELLENLFEIADGVAIPVGGYTFSDVSLSYQLGAQRRTSGSFSVQRGAFFSGDITAVGFTRGRLVLTPQLSVEPGISINWVDLPEGSFTTNLVTTRVNYTFTPRMFFSGLLQYNSSNDTLTSNLRLRWEYQPGSELFVVYTEDRDTATLDPRRFSQTRNHGFVVKFNKLFRY